LAGDSGDQIQPQSQDDSDSDIHHNL
jgi:hypothetical protein